MNICLVNRLFKQYSGGIETYTYRMALEFAKQGHKVHIVAQSGEKEHDLSAANGSVCVHEFPYKEPDFLGFWRVNRIVPLAAFDYNSCVSKFINGILKDNNIDVVEVPEFDGFYPILGRKFPLVVRLHGYHGMNDKFSKDFCRKRPSQQIVKKIIKKFCDTADVVSPVSRSFEELFVNIFNINKANTIVSYLGVDRGIFYPSAFKDRDKKTVLFVGRLEPSKGIEVIIEAIPRVAEKIPDAKFIFAGRDRKRGSTGQTYKEYMEKTLSNFNIEFVGVIPQEKVAEHYRRSAIAIFPSLFEPGATVAAEASSCGCPSVFSDAGCFSEYFENKRNAIIVPANDPASLSNAIVEMLKSDDLREEISSNVMKLAQDKFELEKIAGDTIGIYEEAIKRFNDR